MIGRHELDIVEQAAGAGHVTSRKMFGEYAIYCDGKVVALVCDDKLFVKPTPEGLNYVGAVVEGEAYPGAKPHLFVDGDKWDDAEWLAGLFKTTAAHIRPPAPRKRRGAQRARA